MKRDAAKVLSLAALCCALLSAGLARAAALAQAPTSPNSQAADQAGQLEAQQMVPARAALTQDIDSKKVEAGAQIRVTLKGTTHLKNGPELRSGTILIGTVTNDDMQIPGQAKLALRFTQAQTRDGKTVPVKATIVGVFGPQGTNDEGYDVAAGDQAPNDWKPETIAMDQKGVLSGIDLHSRIASSNSGVLVSTSKSEVKIPRGTELTLAIAAQQNGEQAVRGGN